MFTGPGGATVTHPAGPAAQRSSHSFYIWSRGSGDAGNIYCPAGTPRSAAWIGSAVEIRPHSPLRHGSTMWLAADTTKERTADHLNTFIERGAIATWAARLELLVDEFISAGCPIWNTHALGQSIVVLRKPA